jgi:hypothetical protein
MYVEKPKKFHKTTPKTNKWIQQPKVRFCYSFSPLLLSFIFSWFFFWAVPGFEFRASCLLGRCCPTSFCFSYFSVRGTCFCPGLDCRPATYAFLVTEIIDGYHWSDWYLTNFLPGLASNLDPPDLCLQNIITVVALVEIFSDLFWFPSRFFVVYFLWLS